MQNIIWAHKKNVYLAFKLSKINENLNLPKHRKDNQNVVLGTYHTQI
jgi:hypothetical protein